MPNSRRESFYYLPEIDKNELFNIAQDNLNYMTKNEFKPERELDVITKWMQYHGIHLEEGEDITGPDPPDFIVRGQPIEVVEVMSEGRRRGDEYKEDLEKASKGLAVIRWSDSLPRVKNQGHLWIYESILKKSKKYESKSYHDLNNWILLVYVNFGWLDKVQWDKLASMLGESNIIFKRVDLLYHVKEEDINKAYFHTVLNSKEGT